jgi:hypothetical protein
MAGHGRCAVSGLAGPRLTRHYKSKEAPVNVLDEGGRFCRGLDAATIEVVAGKVEYMPIAKAPARHSFVHAIIAIVMEGDVKMATVRLAGIVSSVSGVQVASRV